MAKNKTKMVATKKSLRQLMYEYRWIYFLGIPGIVLLFFMNYLPMRNLLMAFQDYNPHLGLLKSPWVGLEHFQTFIPGSEVLQHVEEHADHQWTFFIDVPGSDHPGIDHE